MSDIADRSDEIIHGEIAAGRDKIRKQVALPLTGRCLFCGEDVGVPAKFYNVDCRDDFEIEQAALQRIGQRLKFPLALK